MQALNLRKLVGCSEAERKAWIREGVLVASRSGSGAGVHAEFDMANVIAAALALRMKHMGIKVAHYAPAFNLLHEELRNRSSIEWPRYRIFMTPDKVAFTELHEKIDNKLIGFTLSLEPLCQDLFANTTERIPQLNLSFGLGNVK